MCIYGFAQKRMQAPACAKELPIKGEEVALRGSIKTGVGVRLFKPAAVAERWDPEWRSVAQRGASSSLVSHGLGQGPPNRRTHQTRS